MDEGFGSYRYDSFKKHQWRDAHTFEWSGVKKQSAYMIMLSYHIISHMYICTVYIYYHILSYRMVSYHIKVYHVKSQQTNQIRSNCKCNQIYIPTVDG